MNRKRLLKLADFIEKLPKHKLDMDTVGELRGSKRMNFKECKSAACAMGWTPAVFPSLVKWRYDRTIPVVYVESPTAIDKAAMQEIFDIDDIDADILFGPARRNYTTPKQVAKGIRRYVKTGRLPSTR